MEFIATYQMPLIFGGLLIIMGLIGYEADQREKMKNGDKETKKKKKNKKSASTTETPVADENTVTVVVPETTVDNANYQYEAAVANTEYSNVDASAQQVAQPAVYDAQAYQAAPEQVAMTNAQTMATNESLQAFMEPANNVQSNDTFGMNDMSSFQVPQGTNNDASSGNIDAWKL